MDVPFSTTQNFKSITKDHLECIKQIKDNRSQYTTKAVKFYCGVCDQGQQATSHVSDKSIRHPKLLIVPMH